MQRITADSEIEEVLMDLGVGPGEKLRESSKRKETLEKFAQMRSRNPNTTLELEDVRTAFVSVDEELEEFVNITVTTNRYEQSKTDLPPKYHDYIVQKTMTAHEVGHILYSDWSSLERAMEKVYQDELTRDGGDSNDADTYKLLFQNFYNALEDGAIEHFLSNEFRLEEEIIHLRSTIHENNYIGKEYITETDDDGNPVEVQYQYPFFFAIMAAIINHGVYDNGEVSKLLNENNDKHIFAKRGGDADKKRFVNECLPKIRSYIRDIHNENNAIDRTDEILDLWFELREYIDKSQTAGKVEFKMQQKQSGSDSYLPGVPENMSESHGDQEEQPLPAKPIEGENGEEMDKTYGKIIGDRSESSHEKEGVGSIEKKAQKGIIQESKQQGNDWSDEIEQIIESLGAGEGVDEIAIAEDGLVNQNRKKEAEVASRRAERLFSRRLRHMNKDTVVRGKEWGDIDSRTLINGDRGSTRIFKQTKEGKDKDYSCMLVVDRSGSMSGYIEDVEKAVGAIAWGLERNGVDTSILDTENGMTTLSKPFGTETKEFSKKIFAGRCGGGTPLTHTVKFARQRMKRGQGKYPFMIVITDGRPARKSDFKEEIKNANFPVLGFYMSESKNGLKEQTELYNRAIICSSEDNVQSKLFQLINSIMF
jgi:Mg-chelatase subunit ChlD